MTPTPVKPRAASLKLSREMKVLLILLLMVALIGGWYVWTSGRAADAPAPTPPATPTGDPPTADPQGNSGAGTPSAGTPDSGVTVQPDGQVDVPSLPAFGAVDGSGAATQAEQPPTPGGINPDTALAALPSANPFRPLSVDAGANGTNGAVQANAPAPSSPDTGSAPAAPMNDPRNSAPVVNDVPASSGGVLAISPIPGTRDPVTVTTPPVAGGAFPPPSLPGASSSGPEPRTVTLAPVPAPTPLPRSQPTPTATPTSPVPTPPARTAPVRPPVAGVSVPQDNIDLGGLLAQAPSQGGNVANGGTAAGSPSPAGAGTPSGQTATALPTPGTPQPITQLGGDSSETEPSTAPQSALDQLVQSRDLAFNAAVLGPVNTAIFHTRDGFLVVSVGQPLPDSAVVVREVTATSVTLALGNDTKTLELDKR
ncbi:hypothetical protein DEIPH_ctg044orf0010 [Deinococcus phoenicis]|uniref:Uncharacterized protein n=1 Tax=Deinococcus phoenicis TaxID=1476583 RepID=A0A016QMS3_9DEIO|nr:hypothetical protein [Deinococcus phoenicis]EYB67301.1 hypothetical protein DEIPH_ctg044orf0010 [Deinococcus phoenicis]